MEFVDSLRENFLRSCYTFNDRRSSSELESLKVLIKDFRLNVNTIITYDEMEKHKREERMRISHLLEQSALHLAIKNKSMKLLRFLLKEPRIDVNIQTKVLPPPLLYLIQTCKGDSRCQEFCIYALDRLLRMRFLNLDVKDVYGDFLVHKIVDNSFNNGHILSFVTALSADKRMNWNRRNVHGETAVELAMRNEDATLLFALCKIPEVEDSFIKRLVQYSYQENTQQQPESKVQRPKLPECPVCYEVFRSGQHVFHCAQGHFVCGNCRPRMNHCAECRGQIIGRAFGMEKLITTLDNCD